MSARWQDVMPVVPLARGVPVAFLREGEGWGWVQTDHAVSLESTSEGLVVIGEEDGLEVWGTADRAGRPRLRVDLDDPQGFGYALRLLIVTTVDRGRYTTATHKWALWAHVRGETVDDDRLWLAQELAEVYP